MHYPDLMVDEKLSADLSCRIPQSLKDRLTALKKQFDRSEGWVVIQCLEAHLPVLEHRHHQLNETSPSAPRPGIAYRKPK